MDALMARAEKNWERDISVKQFDLIIDQLNAIGAYDAAEQAANQRDEFIHNDLVGWGNEKWGQYGTDVYSGTSASGQPVNISADRAYTIALKKDWEIRKAVIEQRNKYKWVKGQRVKLKQGQSVTLTNKEGNIQLRRIKIKVEEDKKDYLSESQLDFNVNGKPYSEIIGREFVEPGRIFNTDVFETQPGQKVTLQVTNVVVDAPGGTGSFTPYYQVLKKKYRTIPSFY